MTATSIKNDNTLENLNDNTLEIRKDRVILASYLLSPPSKITNPENTSQFNFVKYHNSKRAKDLLINNTITVTLYNNLLTFRDTGKKFELQKDLLKMMTNKNYNVDLASLSVKKLISDFAKEMYFDVNAPGKKGTRDRSLMGLLKSPDILLSACGISTSPKKKPFAIPNTRFSSSDPNEL